MVHQKLNFNKAYKKLLESLFLFLIIYFILIVKSLIAHEVKNLKNGNLNIHVKKLV